MQTDNDGNLWFVNDLGQVGRLNNLTGIFTTLSEVDGYQKQFFHWAAPVLKDIKGNIYFGGENLNRGTGALYRINPEKYSSASTSSVYLRSLTINQQPYHLSTGINNLGHLALYHDQNAISIETGIIDYYSKGKSRLRYKLEKEGKKENWQYAPAYYTIRYDRLPPGNYKLILQASNAGNEFNGPQKVLTIKVSPAWWNTWWFRILAAGIFTGIIYAIIKYRSRSLELRNIQLEEKVIMRTNELRQSLEEGYKLNKKIANQEALLNERLRISRELHDDIGSTLGSISIYSEVARKRAEKRESTNEVLSKIGVASRELIDKMSDIVWSLNPNNESFEQLQNRMLSFAAVMLAPINIQYDFIADENLKKLELQDQQRKNIFLIFKEALHNIVKYADCKLVSIEMLLKEDSFIMTVKDDGRGFNVSPTFANDSVTAGEHLGGNGIKNMTARADDMNAKLVISSEINEGTTVQLIIRI
jgi:signal transduction histidine kinase